MFSQPLSHPKNAEDRHLTKSTLLVFHPRLQCEVGAPGHRTAMTGAMRREVTRLPHELSR